MLAKATLNAAFGQVETDCSCGEYELPENLREFFEGRKTNLIASAEVIADDR